MSRYHRRHHNQHFSSSGGSVIIFSKPWNLHSDHSTHSWRAYAKVRSANDDVLFQLK